MPKLLKMPSKEHLPDGPHRRFVGELFMHYREANRPTLREIAKWIDDHRDSRDLRGTASTETIRRILSGAVVPRTWFTVETILEALCGLADRSTDEDRWPDDRWSSRTFKEELKYHWNAALDDYSEEDNLPELPPRPSPPAPTPRGNFDDPWASAAPASRSNFDDEPPF